MTEAGLKRWPTHGVLRDAIAGVVFGLALQMKLVPVIYLALVGFVVWAQQREARRRFSGSVGQLAVFGIALVASYVGTDLLIEHGAYLTHFQQSWASHFGAAKSSEYGSASQHPFDWSVLLKSWDVTVPATLGIIILAIHVRTGNSRRARLNLVGNFRAAAAHHTNVPAMTGSKPPPSPGGEGRGEGELLLPLAWLTLTFAVFGIHKPWWAYYYLHTAIPLCWCAGIGIAFLIERVRGCARSGNAAEIAAGRRRNPQARTPALRWGAVFTLIAFGICSVGWMGARVYLQVANLRRAPQVENSPVIAQMKRFKPFTECLYADKPVYSFQADIPMVPSLAVMPVKRLWSGELNNEGIRRELTKYKPGLIVLLNDGRDVPFKDLLDREYQMVYMDSGNRMYALKWIARKAAMEE
jgi:hypothetical protein